MANLFSISEAASIAIHGMAIISRSEGAVNVDKIAELTKTSRHHVAKVFQRLVKMQFLSSTRGPNGGFLLKKKPEEISFLDIYETIEGKLDVPECPMNKQICPFDACIFNNVSSKMTREFRDFLASKRLSKL